MLDVAPALAEAEALVAGGQTLTAIDALTVVNREARSTDIERRLVALRHEAFAALDRTPSPSPWVDSTPVEPDAGEGLPSVTPAELTPERLRAGILRHGCLHVRGLVPPHRVEQLIDDIDRAIAGYDAHFTDGTPLAETAPWFDRFTPGAGYTVGGARYWVRDSGGVWTIESPRGLFDYFETAEECGLRALVAAYLGERPALSLNKSTLRKVPLSSGSEWHQDGAFLGTAIRTLNVWLTLSDCGVDAPGLEVLPRRLDHIVETGPPGTYFDWAVAPAKVDAASGAIETVRPRFGAGDVLLFDELFLHRTSVDARMSRERYAIETWSFAPSVYPGDQIPIVW